MNGRNDTGVEPEIIYISRKHPPSIGGMQKLSARLAAGLRQKQQVTVIAHDCSIWTLGPFLFLTLIRLTVLLVVGTRPRIVHFGDPVVAILSPLCRVAKLPTVVTVHGLDVTYPHPVYQLLLRISLLGIDRFICISRAAKAACLRIGIRADRCVVIVPGVDLVERSMPSSRVDIDWDSPLPDLGTPVLLTVGRLVPRKGVAWFAANVLPGLTVRYPSVTYLVVGEGPDCERIAEWADRAGVRSRVVLAGRLSDEVLRVCWDKSDVYVMPNVPTEHDVEGFGLVAIEAAAAGLPVVATDIEGIQDAIQSGKNGVLVPPENAAAFHAAITQLVDNEDERAEFGRRAAEYTRAHYGWERMVERYIEEYRRLSACRSGKLEK